MTASPTLEAVEAIVRPHLKFLPVGESLGAEAELGALGLDSMASIDLLLDLERAFGIAILDDEITENSFATLADIRALVVKSGE